MPPQQAASNGNAVEVNNVLFYYQTPQKTPLFPKLKLPLRKISLHKSIALNRVSLSIEAGKITALLGKNGSGKTSLIKLISGSRFPQEGSVKVFGLNPSQVKRRIGLCLGNTLVYHRLTGRENLEYFGKLYGVAGLNNRITELTEILQLHDHVDEMVETYSFGMKAKLALARAMIHSPELLILDEPTLGIDFQLALQIREFVRNLNCTILLTTHYMDEADSLADNLIVIDRGTILDSGTRDSVLRKHSAKTVAEVFSGVINAGDTARKAS